MGIDAMYRNHTEKIACGEWCSGVTHVGMGLKFNK
jgi:hypothetical protein